jgi:hypothetical protein
LQIPNDALALSLASNRILGPLASCTVISDLAVRSIEICPKLADSFGYFTAGMALSCGVLFSTLVLMFLGQKRFFSVPNQRSPGSDLGPAKYAGGSQNPTAGFHRSLDAVRDWEYDAPSGFYWSESQQAYYDPVSCCYNRPLVSQEWFSPDRDPCL